MWGFVMCGCSDNCVGGLVIRVLVFIMYCIDCTVFVYCFFYAYLFVIICLYYCKDYSHRVTTQL
jgi:hypothetical protein